MTDYTSDTPGKPIHVGYTPCNIVITPDGKTAYVVVSTSGSVIPIATATNTPGKPIKVAGHAPDRIVMTPNGRTLYVMDGLPFPGGRSYVTAISTATNRVVKIIRLGSSYLFGMVVTANGTTVYVASAGNPDITRGSLIPISTTTNTTGKPIAIRGRPVAIAITP